MPKENLKKESAGLPEPKEVEEKKVSTEPPKVKKSSKENKGGELKDKSLKELIEKNIKWSQVIYDQNKKIKSRMTIMAIGGYLKLILILAPIILAIIYLPALLSEMMEKYGALLGTLGGPGEMGGIGNILEQFNISDILSDMPADNQ